MIPPLSSLSESLPDEDPVLDTSTASAAGCAERSAAGANAGPSRAAATAPARPHSARSTCSLYSGTEGASRR
eukprot:7785284-Pyramimonas_sp.AAC.1